MVVSMIEVIMTRKRNFAGPLLVLLLGLIGIIFSIWTGSIKVLLIFIVPVIVGKGLLAFISIALFLIGMIWLLIVYFRSKYDLAPSNARDMKNKGMKDQKKLAGGILFIGPIPIVLGDRETRSWFPPWWVLFLIAISFVALINLALYLSLLVLSIGIIL